MSYALHRYDDEFNERVTPVGFIKPAKYGASV